MAKAHEANPAHRMGGQVNREGFVVLALCGVGLMVALYLSYIYLTGSRVLCEGLAGCEEVAVSPYSRIGGIIPIPLLGVAGYLAIGLVTLIRRLMPAFQDILLLATFGMALVGVLYSAFLTYVEFFILYAICPWCIASALTMTMIFIIAVRELLAG